ncbi:sodium- and chloride-dependent glycine transporter 1-like [Asterias rubens]|uniref:sodium- and chloride-dependent glycine transporter 1-like n=1 Tax=Asterias rubens TaxID=7604 RepID=UPI001455D238|nr:sodium- and chloride-dependent glycine transporter 1-like [Asterias rubens]
MTKTAKSKDVVRARGTWGNHFEFILSSMGYAVGLGNVWRFPYMVFDNGGGAFLIPYFLMLILAAIPVMFLEVSFGQFSSLGCISCWKISPLFKGVGVAMAVVSSYFCLYYNLIIAYTIRYMVVSFKNPLPWTGCNNTWNTPNCYTTVSLSQDNLTQEDVQLSTYNPGTPNTSFSEVNHSSLDSGPRRIRASEEYWKFGVLNVSEGLNDIGSIQWPLLVSFLCAWILVYLCIIKGVKSSGKVVYFTATFPYFVLVVLFIRGVTLTGAMKGILFFLTPDFEKLLSANVWKAAATQVFFSYGAGWGGIHTLSSYNKFSSNTLRDTLLISMSCALTSIFSGVVIFSIIGFMAHDSNQDIQDVIAAGPGLAFVAYPEAVSRIFVPQLWSFLFFFMLLTVGIDSQFVTLETLITAFIDELESKFPGKVRRWKSWIILLVCTLMFLVGLPFVTQGGTYVMTLFNWYSAGFTPLLLALIELLVISYAYGVDNFLKDVESMLGFGLSMYWKVCWMFVTPVIIVGIMIFSFIDYTPAVNGIYTFPPWAEAIGWTLTLSSLLYVIGYAAFYLATSEGTLLERFKKSITPTKEWGPANNIDRINAGYAPLPGQKDEMETEAIQFEEAPPTYKETTFIDVSVNTTEDLNV